MIIPISLLLAFILFPEQVNELLVLLYSLLSPLFSIILQYLGVLFPLPFMYIMVLFCKKSVERLFATLRSRRGEYISFLLVLLTFFTSNAITYRVGYVTSLIGETIPELNAFSRVFSGLSMLVVYALLSYLAYVFLDLEQTSHSKNNSSLVDEVKEASFLVSVYLLIYLVVFYLSYKLFFSGFGLFI